MRERVINRMGDSWKRSGCRQTSGGVIGIFRLVFVQLMHSSSVFVLVRRERKR